MENKVIFKAGEKVIHHRFGEGVLKQNPFESFESDKEKYPLIFVADKARKLIRSDGKHDKDDLYPSIYYVPQTLDMSKPEPEIGTWGYFWDSNEDSCALWAELCEIDNDRSYKYKRKALTGIGGWFPNFSPDIPPHIKELMNT